jgi:hypothetical protein
MGIYLGIYTDRLGFINISDNKQGQGMKPREAKPLKNRTRAKNRPMGRLRNSINSIDHKPGRGRPTKETSTFQL